MKRHRTPTRLSLASILRPRQPEPARRGRGLPAGRGRGAKVDSIEDKIRYLTNRGVPPPLVERQRPLAAIGRRRDLEWLASRIAAQVAAAQAGLGREVRMANRAQKNSSIRRRTRPSLIPTSKRQTLPAKCIPYPFELRVSIRLGEGGAGRHPNVLEGAMALD